mmetsp:Transcript_18606/g.38193  ORF Transcript_18606/g.38193 Transcript_18606/m.38193 type:complete len:523 (+) Transcript_18606:76-1644(+)
MAAKPGKKSKKSSKSKSAEEEEVKKSSTAIEDEVVSQAQEDPESSAIKSSKKKKKSKKSKDFKDAELKSSLDEPREAASKKTESSKNKKTSGKESTNNYGDSANEEDDDDMKLTLEALDAISDYEDSDKDGNGEDGFDEDNEQMDHDNDEWDAKAQALRQAIQDGTFIAGLKKITSKNKKGKRGNGGGKDDVEEVEIEAEEVEIDEEEDEEKEANEELAKDEEENSRSVEERGDEDMEEEEEEEDEEEEEQKFKALALRTALQSTDRRLPWEETFTIVPPTPLPFGQTDTAGARKRKRDSVDDENEQEVDNVVDIHDDLKREVAFHDCALEAVHLARVKCIKAGIPFTRPEDFFAEMVKTDEHMAKIKDRLIFDTKRMEAVERRKSNREQTVMAKERHAHRLAEKAKAKKAHMSAVEDWKKSAASGRKNLGGRVTDMEEEEERLRGLGSAQNKKRMASNKKYGFGGKRGRFKQNDKKTLDDMSKFNPRGGFGGIGQKTTMMKGGGAGKKRPGKRARDSARSK